MLMSKPFVMTTPLLRMKSLTTLTAVVLAAFLSARCGSSPTAPSNPPSTAPPTTTTPPAASVAVSGLTLGETSIVGGGSTTATVTLTGAAQTGGAAVSLSGGDPANVPDSVMVPAGSTSATFMISTRVVGGTLPATIIATYGGASKSAVLSVTQPTVATANFGVSGPNQSDTCSMNDTGTGITCEFNGSSSTAPSAIVAWDWTFGVPGVVQRFSQTTTGPKLTMPAADCSLLPPPPLPAGSTWVNLLVTLKVHDAAGNVSGIATNDHVRLFPNGTCGY